MELLLVLDVLRSAPSGLCPKAQSARHELHRVVVQSTNLSNPESIRGCGHSVFIHHAQSKAVLNPPVLADGHHTLARLPGVHEFREAVDFGAFTVAFPRPPH